MSAAIDTHAAESLARQEALAARLGRELTYLEMVRADEDVLHDWFAQRRLDEILDYLLYQYESGGGAEWWDELRRVLEAERDLPRLHRLFRGLIPGRVARFWTELPHARKGLVGNVANAAGHKGEALRAMYEYFRVLTLLGESEAAAALREEILLLNQEKKRQPPPAAPRAMDEALFWELIETASREAPTASAFAAALEAALLHFKATEIRRFQQLLEERRAELASWDLWAFAYLARGGCSDDAFDDFRGWVVAQGRDVHRAAVEGPDALLAGFVPRWDLQCEELAYVAEAAYFRRQGSAMKPVKRKRAALSGRPWDEAGLETRYPRIHAYFAASSPAPYADLPR